VLGSATPGSAGPVVDLVITEYRQGQILEPQRYVQGAILDPKEVPRAAPLPFRTTSGSTEIERKVGFV